MEDTELIKVTASYNRNGKKKTCSYTSKENKRITIYDLERIFYFSEDALKNYGEQVNINYSVKYDNKEGYNTYISRMSSKVVIISLNKLHIVIESIIKQINLSIK